MDRQPAPGLLPILRSQQQGEILALLLGIQISNSASQRSQPRSVSPTLRSTARFSAPSRLAWSHHAGLGIRGSLGPTLPARITPGKAVVSTLLARSPGTDGCGCWPQSPLQPSLAEPRQFNSVCSGIERLRVAGRRWERVEIVSSAKRIAGS